MDRQYARIGVLVLSVLLWNVPSTPAQEIGFDDLYSGVANLQPVPSDYAGLDWVGFLSMHVPTEFTLDFATGYVTGMVSPEFVVFNDNEGPAEISSDKPFNLASACLTSAWQEGLQVHVASDRGDTMTVTLSPTGPQLVTFNFEGVTRVTFTPVIETDLKTASGFGFFVMDNVVIAGGDPEPTAITIDIKPGEEPNPININPNSKGVTPVAVLSTESFNATEVNTSLVQFGPGETAPLKAVIEDVNGDKLPDLLLFFRTGSIGITCSDSSATLKIVTPGETSMEGSDSVKPVPCK